MRCLGRIVLAILLLLLLAVGWLYRTELVRWGRGIIDPISAARRVGHPSTVAMTSATWKVDSLIRNSPDSILLNADEMASLVARGASFVPQAPLDSISVELGDRTIRMRTMVNSSRLPERVLNLLPITPHGYEEVIAEGTLTPAREGVAEWKLDRVLVRGLPVPSDLVARVIGKVTGRESDGRLEIGMPRGITGFRVRPEGVAIYRNGKGR
ncbi:MAG: hypothetical protein ABIZ70_13150 [Gemmatimonadales bacterium]